MLESLEICYHAVIEFLTLEIHVSTDDIYGKDVPSYANSTSIGLLSFVKAEQKSSR